MACSYFDNSTNRCKFLNSTEWSNLSFGFRAMGEDRARMCITETFADGFTSSHVGDECGVYKHKLEGQK